ncbi:MAG TPA: carboxypeptidase-like regulatory domain-containing protein [Pyrinomonadaceae bacterium]|nr:carboxypeptidase-like regulatory domain-containing protein [Pyrinomonadaceae bacterium]
MKILLFIILLVGCTLTTNAQSQDTSKLYGTIYDQQGAVIPRAKVTAKGNGRVFETVTNADGFYTLTIPFNRYKPGSAPVRYDITVESPHFKSSEIKGYVFIPSCMGGMSLDIALEVGAPSHTDMIIQQL